MKRPLFWVCIILAVVAVLSVLLSGASNQAARLRQTWPEDPPWAGEKVIFSGKTCEKGFQGDKEYFLLTDLSTNQNAASSRQIISILQNMKTDRIQCFLAAEPGEAMPRIGSRVSVEGEFSFFQAATNPGEFDYAKYYQGRQIGGMLSEARLIEESGRYNPLLELLAKLREYFGRRLDYVFPAKEAGVMRAMLLGDRTQLDPELRELYQEGGIVHILSISGLHVTLLGMGLFSLLRRLGMRIGPAAVIAGSVLLLYGIMTGMSVSACRAIGMFLLRMLALLVGRTYDLPTAVAVMACTMLCLEPVSVLNSGFWLSFGSIFGVGIILPVLEKISTDQARAESLAAGSTNRFGAERMMAGGSNRSRAVRMMAGNMRKEWLTAHLAERLMEQLMERLTVLGKGILRALRAGFAILLATLPLTLWFYYEVPTYATLWNLLVIPLMGPLLLSGMIAMLIPGLGIFGTIDVLGLRFFEKLCLWARELPFSTWNPGCPKVWQIIAYYALLGLALGSLWMRSKKETGEAQGSRSGKDDAYKTLLRRKKEATCMKRLGRWMLRISWLLVAAPILIFIIPARRVTGMTFLDVGQGDCVFIRLENGQTWLYDCGSTSRKDVGERVLLPFLKHEGIHHLNGIFVSHADRDHASGITELLQSARQEGILIDQLYLPNWEHAEEGFSEVLQAAEGLSRVQQAMEQSSGTRVQYLSAGDTLTGKNVMFVVLHPRDESNDTDGNEASLCLWICLEQRGETMTALLTGDVQGTGERELLEELRARGIRKFTVLKCAHHGSQNATSPEFLDQVDADVTVISCGRNNVYGHPHEELRRRLTNDGTAILRTDRSGAITIQVTKTQVWVYVK